MSKRATREQQQRLSHYSPQSLPGAGRTIALKAGERVRVEDPLHRTKGARRTKTYRESDRPKGMPQRAELEFEMARMTSRQRYKLRRKIRRQMERENGLATKVAPALKG